ncbi:hypothetical protein GJU41_12085 [Bacillus idriensis]|uniref:Holin n=1 Tax=Metabacillus idriensis TaxID=324768 RepID=A0A6I2MFX9_9BACI|nr:phage holin [Metabacillus idriensis]MRX54713.1 hypothetical protein [Metabacillus idriensis]
MKNSRWSNYGLWIALVSAVLLAVQAVGALVGFTLEDAKVSEIMVAVNAILGVLVAMGIITNPSNGTGFNDEEK